MDSKSGSQGKSIKRRKSGKGKKDMEGNYVPNKNRNLKEKDWENPTSAHTSQKVVNNHGRKAETVDHGRKAETVESSKTTKETKVSMVITKSKPEEKTLEKIKKCDDAVEAKGKKPFNLGEDFKDAIEKRNDEAEAGIHSLSKNMKYARMKKKTNEKIQDSWNRSFMKNTASFMVKEEMKQDKIRSEKNDDKEDGKESLDDENVECKEIENIIRDEIKNGNESTESCDEQNPEQITSERTDITEEKAQVSISIESMKEADENFTEENKEKKDPNVSSSERTEDSKDYTTQTKFPPYRSRFVNDSEGIKKFIKDHSKTKTSTRPPIECSHQKQESTVSSNEISNEISKESVEPLVVQSGDVIDEEERPVKFFISDDESDSDTAIFVDAEQSEPQDQDISDADEKVPGSDNIKSEKETLSDQIIKNDEKTEIETPNSLEKQDMLDNDSCLPINKETDKDDSSVYIDMIEDSSEIISDKDKLENTETDKSNIPNISTFDYGASAIDQIFHDLTSDHKDNEDIIIESQTKKEKDENLICFPWAGEETQDYKLGQVLKSTSEENQDKKCECESDSERVDFAEPKSSEDKEKPSKADQSSRTISGFGRSYRNFQRFEGLTSSITQEKYPQTALTGDETSLSMGKREDIPGQDNMVCGTISNDTNNMKDTSEIVDTMSFLGITNKEDAPNIRTSLEKMEGELELKTAQYIKQKDNELASNLHTNAKSKNPFHPENQTNKSLNEPLPFATAFETLASIKKSLLEAQEYPFQNKLNELSGYTKMKSDDTNVSRDCKSENNQKTACNNSTKSTAGIGDKIKEMLGLCNINEENSTPVCKTVKNNAVHSTHMDMSNTLNFGEQSQNNFNQLNSKNVDGVDKNSESNTQIEASENITLPSNSSLKEMEGAVSKAEIVLKSGKNVFNICDPRKISFSGINKKYKVDINPHENQSNRLVNQKEVKGIKPLKKYSTRSLSQPVPVRADCYEIISESNILPQTEFTNECRNNRLKSEKSSLRRTMSQDEADETPVQTTHPSKSPPKKVAEKILNNIENHKELSDSTSGDPDKNMKLTEGDSKLIDLETCEDTSLITWSTESPIIDHCKSSEYDSYTKYFKKFTHTKSEKFVHTLTDTTYETLEEEKSKVPESGINTGLWNQKKFDELHIKTNIKTEPSCQDRSNEDYSSILIFDDLCPDKWKEQCNVDVNVDKQNGTSFKLGNSSGMKKEPFQPSIVSDNSDNKADPLNTEKQSQSSIKKHKVSWLLNNESDIAYSESTASAKQSVTAGAHSKPKRLQSPPPKLPSAIEITDADFDSAIMCPTSPDFKASGSLNTLLSKLSNADICMDKKYSPLTKIADHFQSVQQSKAPLFTSTIKVSEGNNSSKDKEPETYFKRPELVSTTIADWKVSSPVFEALNILNPPPTKNPNTSVSHKEHTQFMDLDNKVTSDESTKTTENVVTSMLTFSEKLSSTTEIINPSALTFTEKNSAPSTENKLSSSLFSVREKRTPVTPIQSPTAAFKGILGIPTLPNEDFSFSDILEDSKFKLEGVKSTKI